MNKKIIILVILILLPLFAGCLGGGDYYSEVHNESTDVISGKNYEIDTDYGNVVVSGTHMLVIIKNSSVSTITISGVNNIARIPYGANPRINITGVNNKIERY